MIYTKITYIQHQHMKVKQHQYIHMYSYMTFVHNIHAKNIHSQVSNKTYCCARRLRLEIEHSTARPSKHTHLDEIHSESVNLKLHITYSYSLHALSLFRIRMHKCILCLYVEKIVHDMCIYMYICIYLYIHMYMHMYIYKYI